MKKLIAVFVVAMIFLVFPIFTQLLTPELLKNHSTGTAKAYEKSGFVYRSGTQFILDNKPFYFAGMNSYDLFTRGDGSNVGTLEDIENKFMNKSEIDSIMRNMALDGVKVLRTWGFSHENWHGFEPEKGKYYEPQFMLFDYIIESARKNGIKVIVVLENYWEAYGGIDKRLEWEGLPGGSHANRAKFFVNEGCKQQFKKYAEYFVNRINHYTGVAYKDDPAIFAWELMNEPRYQDAGENSTGTTLRKWVDEMAGYIKKMDPNHMVSVGIEGHGTMYGFGGDEGNPFVYINESPYIDYCNAHPYPDEYWANLSPEQNAELIKRWIQDARQKVGKPFVIGEFNTHKNKIEYWQKAFKVMEDYNGNGTLMWEYNNRILSDFTILHGSDEVNKAFIPHAKNMAKKTGIINVSPIPTKPSNPTPTKESDMNYVLDSFDDYIDNNSLQRVYQRNSGGNNVYVELSNAQKEKGSYGMKFDYTLGSPDYAGVMKRINENWSGYNKLRFWIKPDNSGNMLTIQFKESSGEYWEAYIELKGTQESVVELSLSKFKHPSWYNDGNNVIDLDSIEEFAIYVNTRTSSNNMSSTLYFDSFELLK